MVKKRLSAILVAVMLMTTLAACSKPNAKSLADKINSDYNIALSAIGGEGSAYPEFQAETTVEFLADGINAIEEYVFKYNEKNGKPNAYVYQRTCVGLGDYTLNQYEYFFYDELMQDTIFEDGVAIGRGVVRTPSTLLGGKKIDEFKAQFMRVAMPAEVFIREQLVDLKAKRRSNRTVVTASANPDYLETIMETYYRNVQPDTLDTSPYMGVQKLYRFDSVDYEYAVRNGRIASKKVTINGLGYKLNPETSIHEIIEIKVVQTTLYTYSVNMAAHDLSI